MTGHSSSAKKEAQTLSDSIRYMASELGLDIVVHPSGKIEYDPQNKARFALPGRVSLFIE